MELLNYVQTINNTLQESKKNHIFKNFLNNFLENYVFIKNSKEIQQQFYKNIVYLVYIKNYNIIFLIYLLRFRIIYFDL